MARRRGDEHLRTAEVCAVLPDGIAPATRRFPTDGWQVPLLGSPMSALRWARAPMWRRKAPVSRSSKATCAASCERGGSVARRLPGSTSSDACASATTGRLLHPRGVPLARVCADLLAVAAQGVEDRLRRRVSFLWRPAAVFARQLRPRRCSGASRARPWDWSTPRGYTGVIPVRPGSGIYNPPQDFGPHPRHSPRRL